MAPGTRPKPSDKRGAEIADDVSVEIFEQQHVVLIRIGDELHAGVVNDVLAVRDLGVILGDVARAADEKAIGKLHDVGLVDGVNLLAADLRAYANANLEIRVEAFSVMILMLSTTPGTTSCSMPE